MKHLNHQDRFGKDNFFRRVPSLLVLDIAILEVFQFQCSECSGWRSSEFDGFNRVRLNGACMCHMNAFWLMYRDVSAEFWELQGVQGSWKANQKLECWVGVSLALLKSPVASPGRTFRGCSSFFAATPSSWLTRVEGARCCRDSASGFGSHG